MNYSESLNKHTSQPPDAPSSSDSDPRFATEDDFPDDCPLCEMMREDIRNGAKIEMIELDLDFEDFDD
jgi:hypothetical protein